MYRLVLPYSSHFITAGSECPYLDSPSRWVEVRLEHRWGVLSVVVGRPGNDHVAEIQGFGHHLDTDGLERWYHAAESFLGRIQAGDLG